VGVATKFTFGNKPLGGSYRERHYHKPWFDVDYCTSKRELRLWLKSNPDLHAIKHRKVNFKNIKKEKKNLGNYKSSTYVCVCQGGCTFVLEKLLTNGTCCGQHKCNYAFGRLLQVSRLVSTTHMVVNRSLGSGERTST
jgi:hypothetical protein